jgi:type IX secretion system PorP/SprF family membrane protein
MNIPHKILFFFFITATLISSGQDIHFSQFFQSPILRNPSLGGIYSGDYRVRTAYRSQWNKVSDAYNTGAIDAIYKLPVGSADDFFTAGMQVLYDKAGTISLSSTHIMPSLSYHKSLSDEINRYVSVGFMGGIVQRSLDRSKITTNSQYDGLGDGETFGQSNFSYLDGGVGVSYNSALTNNPHINFYMGAAYHHFNKPKNSFYNDPNFELKPKMVLSGGIKMCITDYSFLSIHANHSKQGGFTESIGGATYGVNIGPYPDQPDYTIQGGAFLRWNDALVPVIMVDYAPFSVSMSYDVNLSKLKPSSYGRGGFELSLIYTGFLNRMTSNSGTSDCSKF